jgi:GTP-binding protein HflX
VPTLLEAVTGALDEARVTEVLSVPFSEGRRRAWLFEQGVVVDERQTDIGHDLTVHWTARQRAAFNRI